jgi:hypothetical protein
MAVQEQRVQVIFEPGGTAYTYGWTYDIAPPRNITPLAVGEMVWTPGNAYRPEEAKAEVIALGSHYTGKVSYLLGRAGE